MVSDREDRKQTAKPIDVSEGQGSTTENIRKIANREDRKETVTRPSISQARQAKDKTNISPENMEKKEKGELSHSQGSTTGHIKIYILQRRKRK